MHLKVEALSMNQYQDGGFFRVSSGKRVAGRILFERPCGHALKFDHPTKPYYEMNLWIFDKILYVCRSAKDLTKYTVFAGFDGDAEKPTFKEPVGCGHLTPELRSHLEIQLNFPRQRVFISLHPESRAAY